MADRSGLDIFGIGEHHTARGFLDFRAHTYPWLRPLPSQKRIRLTSAVDRA